MGAPNPLSRDVSARFGREDLKGPHEVLVSDATAVLDDDQVPVAHVRSLLETGAVVDDRPRLAGVTVKPCGHLGRAVCTRDAQVDESTTWAPVRATSRPTYIRDIAS